MNGMSLQQKIENEISILRRLIARYEQSDDIGIVIAYEYGLQVLIEIYELSKQKEVMPF
ncbi:hypothetical protein P4276_28970 [Bacillus thuringiensis]|nr:hypothetical protein [Bacillus thuringiensis]